MTDEEFNQILESRLRKTEQVLGAKAGEYASGRDRLHNFKQAAKFTDGTPAQACVGFMVKHLVSVLDIVADQARGDTKNLHRLDEKIGDAINYLVLLEAILSESKTP